jgi:hypothetical protein
MRQRARRSVAGAGRGHTEAGARQLPPGWFEGTSGRRELAGALAWKKSARPARSRGRKRQGQLDVRKLLSCLMDQWEVLLRTGAKARSFEEKE